MHHEQVYYQIVIVLVFTGMIVQRIRDNCGWNRALCDKSTKFGTVVVYGKVTILKIGGTLEMP